MKSYDHPNDNYRSCSNFSYIEPERCSTIDTTPINSLRTQIKLIASSVSCLLLFRFSFASRFTLQFSIKRKSK